jgi:hypothetical protein
VLEVRSVINMIGKRWNLARLAMRVDMMTAVSMNLTMDDYGELRVEPLALYCQLGYIDMGLACSDILRSVVNASLS